MTTVNGSAQGSSNTVDTDSLSEIDHSSLGAHSATSFVLSNPDFTVTAQGSGLSYSSGHPSGGTITSLTIQEGISTMTWTGFSVSASTMWHDISTGDVAGFESLFFSGNDTFNSGISGSGGDVFSGFGGDDTFVYTNNFSILSNLDGGDGNDTLVLNGDYSNDNPGLQLFDNTITSVENIVFTAGHTYRLTTSDGNVAAGATLTINGTGLGAGDSMFFDGSAETNGKFITEGSAGSDTVLGGMGDDTFNGGGGSDWVSYAHTNGVTVNLSLTTAQVVGSGQGHDTFISIENLIGSSGNDTLTGNSGNNIFQPGTGTDVINGGGGSDTISFANAFTGVTVALSLTGAQTIDQGGDKVTLTGISNITGSLENDTLSGNSGDNVIDGGAGTDTLALTGATSGVTFDFSGSSIAISGGGLGHDTLVSIEKFAGSGFDDVAIASATQNLSFDGGDGSDTVNYSAASGPVFIDLNNDQEYGLLSNGTPDPGKPTGSWLSVEDAVGSKFNDHIRALSEEGVSGTVDGGDGNDTIEAFNSTEALQGGAGNDTITVNDFFAADTIDGGSGNDSVFIDPGPTNTAPVVFAANTITNVETLSIDTFLDRDITTNDGNLAAGQTMVVKFGDISGDSVGAVFTFNGGAETNGNFDIESASRENILTLGAGNDLVNATSSALNIIDISHGGNDTLNMGNNNDTVNAGGALTASDRINAGANTDTVNLDGDYSAGLTLKSTTLVGVENLVMVGGHSYSLITNNATVAAGTQMTIDASALGAGDHLAFDGTHETDGSFNVLGGAGADTIKGSKGNDVIDGGGGNDTLVLDHGGNDTVTGRDGDDTMIFKGALTAADFVDGGTGNDTVTLLGNYAAGVVFTDDNFVSVENLLLTVHRSYKFTASDATVAPGDTLTVNGEKLVAADHLTFDGHQAVNGSFVLEGGQGNDTLTGGLGNDTLYGGKGADHLDGGTGADHFLFKHAADSTGATFDTLSHFDAAAEKLDLSVAISHIDAAKSGGALSAASFDADMASALGSLSVHHAVLFTATGGDYSGDTFLIVNLGKTAGYHAGQDLVIMLDHASNLGSFGAGDFI